MRKAGLLVWLVLLIFKVAEGLPPLGPCRPPRYLRNTAVTQGAFHREKVENDLLCYDLCWSFSDCGAASFSEETRLCTLVRKKKKHDYEKVPQRGSMIAFAYRAMCKPFDDPCDKRPCKPRTKCVTQWKTDLGYECKPSGCQTPEGFLDKNPDLTTTFRTVLPFVCPDGQKKGVMCDPRQSLKQFQCSGSTSSSKENHALMIMQKDKHTYFDFSTKKQRMGHFKDLKGKEVMDVTAPSRPSNVVLITTGSELYKADLSKMKADLVVRKDGVQWTDCDEDMCAFTVGRDVYQLDMKTFRKHKMFGIGKITRGIAVDAKNKIIYRAKKGSIAATTFTGKDKKIAKVDKHHDPMFLALDRKSNLLYCVSTPQSVILHLKTRKLSQLPTIGYQVTGMVFYENSLILLHADNNRGMLMKLDPRTAAFVTLTGPSITDPGPMAMVSLPWSVAG